MRWHKILVFLYCLSGFAGAQMIKGNRVHICGTVVNENLEIIKDSLLIKTTTSHPFMNLSSTSDFGEVKTSDGKQWITNGKFCIDGHNSIDFSAHVNGKFIDHSYLSVGMRPLNISDYKWIVDRNPKMGKRPNFDYPIDLVLTKSDTQGFSILSRGTVTSNSNKGIPFYDEWFGLLNRREGRTILVVNPDSQRIAWQAKHTNLIHMNYDSFNKRPTGWELEKPFYLSDFQLRSYGDSLFITQSKFSNTKFYPMSLDTPICNFGRLPGPEIVKNKIWNDSLLIAIKDRLVTDIFFVDFPWAEKWGKMIIDPKIHRDSTIAKITISEVLKNKSDTSTFLFWRNSASKGFPDRAKCLTPVESMRLTEPYRTKWD